MQAATALSPAVQLSSLHALFAHYVTGQIADDSWSRFMYAFDEGAATADEREAMAAFFHEALCEFGPESVVFPKVEEVQALLTEVRA